MLHNLFEKIKQNKQKLINIAIIIFSVTLFVTLCSKCSFLYPFNDWVDSNVFFTVGKALTKGKVLYRDIYDQKGLYLFWMHSLAYFISEKSFIGIYLFELIFGYVFAYSIYKILTLYITEIKAIMCVPVICLLSYATNCFKMGDSAEEFVMPFIALSLYFILKYAKGGELTYFHQAAIGLFAGFTFWIKYTLCGFYLGIVIIAFILQYIKQGKARAAYGFLTEAAAVIVGSIPVFAYFGAHGAFKDLWVGYFYDNLFLYSAGYDNVNTGFFKKIGMALWAFIRSFYYGWLFYLSALPGLIYFIFAKSKTRLEKSVLFTVYGCGCFFVYAGGRGGAYYTLPFCIFSYTGFVALFDIKKLQELLVKAFSKVAKYIYCFAGGIILLSGVLAYALSMNTYMLFKDKDELLAYRFGKIVSEVPDATILNYECLDLGIYTVTGYIPSNKYFFKPNFNSDEITNEQNELVSEGKVDFVVSENVVPKDINNHYILLDSMVYRDSEHTATYYLYGLNKS